MRTCEEYRTLISALIDDEISEGDRAELMAHLAECEECRAAMDDLFAVHEAMRTMECAAPAGFADAVMAKVHETKQELPEKKVIPFPHWKRWAGLAACCAVIVLGIFGMDSGFLSAETTSDSAAPEAASVMNDAAQKAETSLAGGAAPVPAPEAPAAPEASAAPGTGAARTQSERDNGACVADSDAVYSEYAGYAEFAARITTGSDAAADWVEETLDQAWVSGTYYLLTAEQYADLLALLEQNGEEFTIQEGEENSGFYQLLAE